MAVTLLASDNPGDKALPSISKIKKHLVDAKLDNSADHYVRVQKTPELNENINALFKNTFIGCDRVWDEMEVEPKFSVIIAAIWNKCYDSLWKMRIAASNQTKGPSEQISSDMLAAGVREFEDQDSLLALGESIMTSLRSTTTARFDQTTKEEIESLKNQISDQRHSIASFEQHNRQRDEIIRKLKQRADEGDQWQNHAETLKEAFNTGKQQNESLVQKIAEKDSTIESLKQQISQHQSQLSSFEQEIRTKNSELDQWQNSVKNHEEAWNTGKQQNESLEKKIAEKDSTIESLKQQISQYDSQLSSFGEIRTKNSELENRWKSAIEQNKLLLKKVSDRDSTIESLQADNASHKNQIDVLSQRLDECVKGLKESQEAMNEHSTSTKMQQNSLTAAVKERESIIAKLRSDMDQNELKYQREIEGLKDELSTQKLAIEELAAENDEKFTSMFNAAEEENRNLQNNNISLRNQLTSAQMERQLLEQKLTSAAENAGQLMHTANAPIDDPPIEKRRKTPKAASGLPRARPRISVQVVEEATREYDSNVPTSLKRANSAQKESESGSTEGQIADAMIDENEEVTLGPIYVETALDRETKLYRYTSKPSGKKQRLNYMVGKRAQRDGTARVIVVDDPRGKFSARQPESAEKENMSSSGDVENVTTA